MQVMRRYRPDWDKDIVEAVGKLKRDEAPVNTPVRQQQKCCDEAVNRLNEIMNELLRTKADPLDRTKGIILSFYKRRDNKNLWTKKLEGVYAAEDSGQSIDQNLEKEIKAWKNLGGYAVSFQKRKEHPGPNFVARQVSEKTPNEKQRAPYLLHRQGAQGRCLDYITKEDCERNNWNAESLV